VEDFILLGQIPGTTFTITFGVWLLVCAWLLALTGAWRAFNERKQLSLVIAGLIVAFSIRHYLHQQDQVRL
jgi:hypothetical protein